MPWKIFHLAALFVLCCVALVVASIILYLWPYAYEGDGVFIDSGWNDPGKRYTLVLDVLRSDIRHDKTYFVGHLPHCPFWWGFRVSCEEERLFNRSGEKSPWGQHGEGFAKVLLEVRDLSTGELVSSMTGSLSVGKWIDISHVTDEVGKKYTSVFITGSPDQGSGNNHTTRGTEFTPTLGHSYLVHCKIEDPDKVGLDLVLEGRGLPEFHLGSL